MLNVKTIDTTEPVAITNQQPQSSHLLDRYPYGWRYVRRVLNGDERWERVPLTRNDLLHPQLGDTRVHNEYHERFSTYLYDVLVQQVAHDPHAFVLHDVGIVWDNPRLKHHSPDIAVIFNVREHQEWSTFNVAEEGTKPTLIIEVTSLSNRSTDLVDKLDEYQEAGVPYYVTIDTFRYKGKRFRRLQGHQLDEYGHYQVMPRNEKGWLWLPPVEIWLAIEDSRVVCYDKEEQPIANYSGVVAQRDEARAKVQAQAEENARLRAELARFREANAQ